MFDIFIGVFFALYVTSIIYVLWQTFLSSISPEIENLSVKIRFWTNNPTLKAYEEVWKRVDWEEHS